MHSHKLHELSQFERDNLIATIPFVDKPRKFIFDETLPFPNSLHIVNYSEFYEALDPTIKEENHYVAPGDLRNGDMLKFSSYRECATYYCFWLHKDLVNHRRLFELKNTNPSTNFN